MCIRDSVRTVIGAVSVECGRPKWPITMLSHTHNTHKKSHIHKRTWYLYIRVFCCFIFGTLCSYDPLWRDVFFSLENQGKNGSLHSRASSNNGIFWIPTSGDHFSSIEYPEIWNIWVKISTSYCGFWFLNLVLCSIDWSSCCVVKGKRSQRPPRTSVIMDMLGDILDNVDRGCVYQR